MKTVAIIGGGFSGTMTLYHLVSTDGVPPTRILFFDDANRHARGVAYSTPVDEHLLNVPAGGMTALPDDSGHFVAWLKSRVAEADAGVFYPRRLYGEYVQEFYDTALIRARDNEHDVVVKNELVTRIEKSANGSLTVNGQGVDAVVLATGASQPRWPGGMGIKSGDARLIDNPYGSGFPAALEAIKTARSVAVLGTGLSGADAVMSLHRSGFTGHIICISRHGNWPVQHGLKKPWDWRRVIDSLRPHSNNIWRGMAPGVRAFCLRHIGFWNVVRHRMPRQCRAVIQSLKRTGQLKVVRGSIREICADHDKINIILDGNAVQADAVINCLGFIGAGVLSNPLYRTMEKDGLIRVKDGLLDPDDFRLSPNDPVYVLGPPLFGYFIETSAVPELRVQAKKVAGKIATLLAA